MTLNSSDFLSILPVLVLVGWASVLLLVDLFLKGDVDDRLRAALQRHLAASAGDTSKRMRQFAHSVVTLPEFHLC